MSQSGIHAKTADLKPISSLGHFPAVKESTLRGRISELRAYFWSRFVWNIKYSTSTFDLAQRRHPKMPQILLLYFRVRNPPLRWVLQSTASYIYEGSYFQTGTEGGLIGRFDAQFRAPEELEFNFWFSVTAIMSTFRKTNIFDPTLIFQNFTTIFVRGSSLFTMFYPQIKLTKSLDCGQKHGKKRRTPDKNGRKNFEK